MKTSTVECGLMLLLSKTVLAATHYVDLNSPSPTPPYTNWGAAARVIQDALDAVAAGDEVVVTNGNYVTGATVVAGFYISTNRVAVNRPILLRSLNGPQFTIIDGAGTARCVYLASGAVLSGFTLTSGVAPIQGGGVWCQSSSAAVSNCVLIGNSTYPAADEGGDGGGAYGGTLVNCILTGNWSGGYERGYGGGAAESILWNCVVRSNTATGAGGGAHGCILNNCWLSSNSASTGGGAEGSTLNNCVLAANSVSTDDPVYWGAGGGADNSILNGCTVIGNSAISLVYLPDWPAQGGGVNYCTVSNSIVYSNTASQGANYDSYSVLSYCCTTPMPTNGFGNITNAPLFADQAGGNLRLQSSSPCINAGNNLTLTNYGWNYQSATNDWFTNRFDLDGNPRIAGGTVDIGAYEFQNPASVISYAWLRQYGLPTDGSADFSDPDGDGLNNWQEWRCQTDPTKPGSSLRLLSLTLAGNNVTVTWQSVAGVSYFLRRGTNLANPAGFVSIATNLPGVPGTVAYHDTNAAGSGPFFYRVGVQ